MDDHTLELLKSNDTFRVIDYLNAQPEAEAVAEYYMSLVKHFYWDEPNLLYVVTFARAGIQFCLDAARQLEKRDSAHASRLKERARAISYNLASFTWPGWGKPNMGVDSLALSVGLDASYLCRRLVEESGSEPIRLARTYWLTGAHQLAAGEADDARNNFIVSSEFATKANVDGDALLAEGFSVLAEIQANGDEAAGPARLAMIFEKLEKIEHGPAFIDQIRTAGTLFNLDLTRS